MLSISEGASAFSVAFIMGHKASDNIVDATTIANGLIEKIRKDKER